MALNIQHLVITKVPVFHCALLNMCGFFLKTLGLALTLTPNLKLRIYKLN